MFVFNVDIFMEKSNYSKTFKKEFTPAATVALQSDSKNCFYRAWVSLSGKPAVFLSHALMECFVKFIHMMAFWFWELGDMEMEELQSNLELGSKAKMCSICSLHCK